MSEKEKIILPPKYYLDYFNDLLSFIQKCSSHCLDENDLAFVTAFNALSEDAQCLLLRMANRKGEYFRLDKLTYEEIGNSPAAAEELVEAEIASLDPPDDPHLFLLFTKSELHQLYPKRDLKSKYKEDVILELAGESVANDYKHLRSQHSIVQFLRQEQFDYFKLLFFGHNHGMMTEFVIRDVGNIKLENLEGHEFTPWYDYLEEAKAVFELYKWDSAIKRAMQTMLPEEILELVGQVNWSEYINHPKSRKAGDKFMMRLGEYFEKAGLLEDSSSFYSLARKHPARERRIRIYEKLGDETSAKDLAEVAFDNPYNASEKIFCKDFLAKKSLRNYRSTTARIKESPEIRIDLLPGLKVEDLALLHYHQLGYQGSHTENYLWRGLFGLVFWAELFDQNHQSFHHPLQRLPSDLYDESFYEKRKANLKKKTDQFRSKKNLIQFIKNTYFEKEDINNPLVNWHETLLPTIENCVLHLPLSSIKNVLLEMSKNVKDNSTGFPDLFLWNDESYYFYEIKSPNDHLSSQQLFWLDFFKEQKINADILRVNFN